MTHRKLAKKKRPIYYPILIIMNVSKLKNITLSSENSSGILYYAKVTTHSINYKGAGCRFIRLLQQGCSSRAYREVFTRSEKSICNTFVPVSKYMQNSYLLMCLKPSYLIYYVLE